MSLKTWICTSSVLALIVLMICPSSFAQLTITAVETGAMAGLPDGQAWAIPWEPQDVDSIDIRYRAKDLESTSPSCSYNFWLHNSGNWTGGSWNLVNAQLTQPVDTNWITATIIPPVTADLDRIGLWIFDQTAGATPPQQHAVGGTYGLDIDYIRLHVGPSTVDIPLQDDGSRGWGISPSSGVTGAFSGTNAGGAEGDVVQVDCYLVNGWDELAECNYYWSDPEAVGGAVSGTTIEWTWRSVPGDATDSLDIQAWVRTTDWGWYRVCDWGYLTGTWQTQPTLNWSTSDVGIDPLWQCFGVAFNLSDSGFSGTLDRVMRGVQINTISILDATGTPTVVLDTDGPNPVLGRAGCAENPDGLSWDQRDHYSDYDASDVRDWMLY